LVQGNRIKEIDGSFLEYSIFGLFTIDLQNFIYIKAILAKEFHIQPSELERMPAWEYELFMQEINKAIKEDNKRNKEEEDKYNVNDMRKMADRRNIDKMTSDSYKKVPNVPSVSSMTSQLSHMPSISGL
jgi:hypothetical protein